MSKATLALLVGGLLPAVLSGVASVFQKTAARADIGTGQMMGELRAHVRTNAFDPEVERYRDLARETSAPVDELDASGRIALPDATVSTLGLSAALAPMVARIAEGIGMTGARRPGGSGAVPIRCPLHSSLPLPPEPGASPGGRFITGCRFGMGCASSIGGGAPCVASV